MCLEFGPHGVLALCHAACAELVGRDFLKAHCIRTYESVSGPLLEELSEAFGRFTTLSDVSEDLLWDDVGVVAAEDYRQPLYGLMGFTGEGERAPSPEI